MPSYEGYLPYLILSTAHNKTAERYAVAEILRKMGFRVKFYSLASPPSHDFKRSWQRFCKQSFNTPQASGMAAIVDKHYLESEYCRAELILATVSKLPIFAFFIDDTPIPDNFRNLFEDSVNLYCESPYSERLSILTRSELDTCREQTPLVPQHPDFEAYSDVLVAYRGNAETVSLPKGFAVIEQDAFKNRTEIKKISLPETVRQIKTNAFFNCTALRKIVLPEGLERIEFWAFKGCTALTEVTLPKTVTYIHEEAFSSCAALEKLYVPKNVKIPDKLFSLSTQPIKIIRI